MLKLKHLFSLLNKQQILNSSYEQLVDRIARTYNLKQYKNQSGLCLLEMHHQFKLFNPGDWVLDVGSGEEYAWTDLALKLTQNKQMNHKVISNDILQLRKARQSNIFIRGDIKEEPVQTKIGLELQNRNLDTILIDVSPPFTGNVNRDGRQIMNSVDGVMNLAHSFLRKGGNMVCKVLQSEAQPLLNETFQLYFNEKYKYVPTIMRKTSPVCFYVMKGFLISQSYHALNDFINNYKGTTQKKIKLVEKYQGKYHWDPVRMIKKYILNDILKMRSQGRSEKDILKVFATDPYAKAEKTLRLLKQAEQAEKDRNMVLHFKLLNQLTQGQLYKNAQEMPTTREQFCQKVLEKMEQIVKEDKQKKTEKKQKISRAPLKENETYMKVKDNVKQKQDIKKQYFYGDLHGKYSGQQTKEQIDLQLEKIIKIHPEVDNLVKEIHEASKDSSTTIEQILEKNKKRQQELSEEQLRNIQYSVEDSIRNMSSQGLDEQSRLQKEIYRRSVNEQKVQKADRYINQRRSKRKKVLF